MQGTPPLDDVRAEQDRVAALIDDIAREVGADSSRSADPVEELPAGPALTTADLEKGILRLIADLAGPDQTQADFVSSAFAVALKPDSRGKVTGAQGRLNAGTYEIAVSTLYRGNPGRHISILVEHPDKNTCLLTFDALAEALTSAGYVGQALPRSLDPRVSFSKSLGAIELFVSLDTDRHDAPRCVWQVSFDVEPVDD